MRMWLVKAKIMCRQHLLGEHLEIHMFVGTINKGYDVSGYIKNNLLQVNDLYVRHQEIVEEMKKRGYKHKSELKDINYHNVSYENLRFMIDKNKALEELLRRCTECRQRYDMSSVQK